MKRVNASELEMRLFGVTREPDLSQQRRTSSLSFTKREQVMTGKVSWRDECVRPEGAGDRRHWEISAVDGNLLTMAVIRAAVADARKCHPGSGFSGVDGKEIELWRTIVLAPLRQKSLSLLRSSSIIRSVLLLSSTTSTRAHTQKLVNFLKS